MIHRKTTKTLAELYGAVFTGTHESATRVNIDRLYDSLFCRGYSAYFLFLVKNRVYSTRALVEFIMKLHTGESLYHEAMQEQIWPRLQEEGQELLRRLAQDIIAWYNSSEISSYDKYEAKERISKLVAELELDGYIYRDGKLYFSESNVLDEQEETGILDGLIVECCLANKSVMDHHLEVSETDYLENKWDDSISNSRKFLESVLQEIADRLQFTKSGNHLDKAKYDKAVEVRKYLQDHEILNQEEVDAVRYVYGLLSETGSHPYIAAKDQARLARNLALSLAQFVLLRFRGIVNKTLSP